MRDLLRLPMRVLNCQIGTQSQERADDVACIRAWPLPQNDEGGQLSLTPFVLFGGYTGT